ncbi:MAG TPA: hypothetical protein VG889_13125 [Rhizomicrobium sp.]|nr:hypothetical protein [Rhizomicrobium sp.]
MTAKSSEREARLAKALRENLKRRKARDRSLADKRAQTVEQPSPEKAPPKR